MRGELWASCQLPDSRKALALCPRTSLLTGYGPDQWTTRWVENWLNCQAERVNSSKLNLAAGHELSFSRSVLELILLSNCINSLGDRIECIFTKFVGGTKLGGQPINHKEEALFRETSATRVA